MKTVKVPQKDGEIVLSVSGRKETYTVTDGKVEVRPSDLEWFSRSVEGAEVLEDAPAPPSPANTADTKK